MWIEALIAAAEQIRKLKQTLSLSELLPWACGLTRNLVLCKDGSLLAGFVYSGLDTEGRSDTELAGDAALLERALGAVASRRVFMWWCIRRDRVNGWVGGRFADPVAARADAAVHRQWNRGNHYVNQRSLWIALGPPTPGETLMSRVANEGTAGFISGLAPWVVGTVTGRTVFEAEASRLLARVNETETLCRRVAELFPDIRMRRLEGTRLWGWLNALASPTVPWHPADVRTALHGLDDALGEDTLDQDAGGMRFTGPTRTRHVAVLTPKTVPEAWPETFHPGILDGILDIDAECVFSLAIRFLDSDASRKVARERRRHLLNWRKGMVGYMKEGLLNVQSEQVDAEKEIQATDADGALRDLVKVPAAGWIFPVLYVRAGSPEAREVALSDAVKAFHAVNFVTIRERMHQLSAWAGTLPGQWGAPVRWTYASAAGIADLCPIRGASSGSRVNHHLSKMTGQRQPALATFGTRSLAPYWLEPHLSDVGHGLILGPTGSGKSVFGGWMAMRWAQYPGARSYIFDKDRSLRKFVMLTGGQYLDTENGLRINPFHGLESESDWSWAVDFVTLLLMAGRKEEPSTADINEVSRACRRVQAMPPEERRLRVLSAFLPARLGERLAQWVDKGRYARYFDHATDSMEMSDNVGIAMDDVLGFPTAAMAFMEIAFHRIRKRLDGAPTYIHVEEGWFLLAEPEFERKLKDWALTLRKLNGVLVISTQQLGQLVESRAFSSLIAAPNRFLLPNPDIHSFEALYRDRLTLTPEQINMIEKARPKGEAVLVRDGRARVLNTRLPPEALTLFRADARADEVFERWSTSGDPDWRMRYVDELVADESR